MTHQYPKPPVVEAICEFRFKKNELEWDWTIPGLIYNQIKESFPIKRTQNQHDVGFEVPDGDASPMVHAQVTRRMQFVSQDEKSLVQAGPHLLSINHLAPYPGWPEFSKLIKRILDVYRDVAQSTELERIGLRYINRLEIPEAKVTLEDYISAVPSVPEGIPDNLIRWGQRIDIPYPTENGILMLQTASLNPQNQGRIVFLLDIDFKTINAADLSQTMAIAWVDKAHRILETAFEASITDKTRSLFEEDSHDHRKAE